MNGDIRTLREVKDIKDQIREGWIYFNFHGLDKDNPPFSQTTLDQKNI